MNEILDESGCPPAERKALQKDLVFDLLSSSRRRGVLTYLIKHTPETTLSELAAHIAANENNTEKRLLSSQQRKRVYVALYQCHLPRMDEANVIDFQRERGTVELQPSAAQLYQYMEVGGIDPDSAETQSGQSISGRVTAIRERIDEWV